MHSAKIKTNCVTQYVIHGNMRRVAAESGVDIDTLFAWRKEDWWKDLEAEIRSGIRSEMLGRMQGIVSKAIDILDDRLDNGDMVLNMKTGEIVRRPVPARDIQKIATEVLGKKLSLEKEANKVQVRQETVNEMLGALAKGFLNFNKKLQEQKQLTDVIDVEAKEA